MVQLSSGQSATLTVTFAPQNAEQMTGVVTINQQRHQFTDNNLATGTGVAPAVRSVALNWNASTSSGAVG